MVSNVNLTTKIQGLGWHDYATTLGDISGKLQDGRLFRCIWYETWLTVKLRAGTGMYSGAQASDLFQVTRLSSFSCNLR